MMEENGLPKGWVETTLGEVALINPRESLKKGTAAVNVPMTSLEPFTKKIQSFEIKEFNGGTKFRNGDTLLARITPCLENGKTAFVDILKENEVGFGSTEYIVIRSKRQCSDKNFLYYLSISPLFREVAKKVMTGTSGRQRVQTDVLINRKFNLPPLSEQKAIASILTSFDDKIELLQAQNETLENIAQTIFKEWFGKYQVGDELPDGWRVGKLSKIANFLNGLALQKYPSIKGEESLPVIKIRELKQGITSNTDRASKHLDPKYIVNDGDILFSWSGSLEVVNWQNGKGALNQHLFKVTSVTYPKWFYYYWILQHLNEFREIASDKATTMGHINRKHLELADIIIPDSTTLKYLDKLFTPLMEKTESNSQHIQTLQATRDTLLPKLMSGQLRVAEFQEQLSEVM